jgi:hypothetical protein
VADRLDYYFRQRVTEAELDLGFELLEKADRNLAADIGLYGVVSGAVPTQHAPIADLTIDLSAPGRAYDRLGQRIFFGTGQRVDLAVDATGIPTEVTTVGQERWVGVFLRFKRLLSDPRTDGNSQQVFFRRDESFELVVRQAPQAAAGSAVRVALVDGELLVCDVKRRAGQTQVLTADIDTSRRQAFVFAQGNAVAVVAGLWAAISKAAGTVQTALDSVDGLLAGHFGATSNRHRAQDVDYPPHGFLAGATVKAALDELVDDLASQSATPGAARVGTKAIPGIPNALAASTVDAHLVAILGWLNAHLAAAVGSHAATAISAVPHAFVATKNVQAQLQEIVADMQSATAGQGAALIGSQALGGSPRAVAATVLRDQVLAILNHLNAHIGSGDHDARYMHRLYSNGYVIPPSTTKVFGVLSAVPDLVTIAYNLVDATDTPVQPQYHHGPYMLSLQAYVDKMASAGPTLTVKNGSGTKLFVMANAYLIG